VVAGGFDVTGHYRDDPENNGKEQLSFFDAILIGRGTPPVWQQILTDFERASLGQVYSAQPNEPYQVVIPRHDLLKGGDHYFPSIRTSDGCDLACPFCTVHITAIARRTVIGKDRSILEQEFKLLPKHRLYYLDTSDSFGADLRHTLDVALPFWKSTGVRWLTEMQVEDLTVDHKGKPLAQLMAESGCRGVFLGIEVFEDKIGQKSVDAPKLRQAIRLCHEHGMLVMGGFILDVTGHETPDSLRRTVDWIIGQSQLDFVQYGLVALLPGSALRMSAAKRGKIIDHNPTHLDGGWPTVDHQIPARERIELFHWALQQTYSLGGIYSRILPSRHGFKLHRLIGSIYANRIFSNSARQWSVDGCYENWLATKDISIYPG